MEHGILAGLAALRWGAWGWVATVTFLARDDLRRPWLAVGLLGAALAVTVTDSVLLRANAAALLRPGPVVAELACGAALLLGDGWAYGAGHAFSPSQSLGVAWPLAGVLAAGVAGGRTVGGVAGAGMGLARLGATIANGVAVSTLTGGRAISLMSTTVLYILAGSVTGHAAGLLRSAESTIAAAHAREEVARTLHDGVLQTLAAVVRRADDPALVRLARNQERELREWLFGLGHTPAGVNTGDALGPALRAAGARFEDAFAARAEVIVADDVPIVADERARALVGAVGEALNNAGKHGLASRVVVYVEPSGAGDGVFCSVKDNGVGFDPHTTCEGVGLSRSIRGRVEEVGGRVEVDGGAGRGAEVRLWL